MIDHVVVPQIEFDSLEDFVKGSNNYFAHFLDDCKWGKRFRERLPFKRFQEAYPEMEKEVTDATTQALRANPQQPLPYGQIWETYKIMSKLVFVDDKYVMQNGQPDKVFLTR